MRLIFVALITMAAALCAAFHPANVASARAKVGVGGDVDLIVRFDILAYVLDVKPSDVDDAQMKELLDLPTDTLAAQLKEAQGRFRRSLKLIGGEGEGTVDQFTFPTAAEVQDWVRANGRDMLPMMLSATAKAHLPKGSRTSAFRFPDVLGTVVLTTEFPYQEPISEPVDPGNVSRPLTLPTADQVAAAQASLLRRSPAPTPAKGHPVPEKTLAKAAVALAKTATVKTRAAVPAEVGKAEPPEPAKKAVKPQKAGSIKPKRVDEGSAQRPAASEPAPTVVAPTPSAVQVNRGPAWFEVLPGYVKMGYLHILPQGLDHILFVLGLFLLSTRMKDLLKQITAFTVAHSLTLALALYGVVRLPSHVVEPLIAASIAFVAIENLFTTQMKAWRVYVVFGFGLVHGLGFAGALQDLGLARSNFLLALLGFNSGVELGQLTVVVAAFLLVGWFRNHQRYRPYVAVPASIAIAVVALFWTAQRLL